MIKKVFEEKYENSTGEGTVYGGEWVYRLYIFGIKVFHRVVRRDVDEGIRDEYIKDEKIGFNKGK